MLSGLVLAESEQAKKLRAGNTLSEFTPPESFLSGNFVADEVDPAYIFGKMKDFVKSRSCPTTWLIEDVEKKRIAAWDKQLGPVEYTLYLEEDCPGKVTYYVFVDRSQANMAQWMEWRRRFHGKSKTEPQYAAARASLEQAIEKGFPVDGELRFVERNGELVLNNPEELLKGELQFKPLYDLRQGQALAR
jgi:hypothetical protein